MAEAPARSLVKTLSYRAAGVLTTAAVALAVTGRLEVALPIGIMDSITKLFICYFHERLWDRATFGRTSRSESGVQRTG